MLVNSHSLIGKTIHKYVKDNLGFNLSAADLKYGCIKPDFHPKLIAISHYKSKSFDTIAQMIISLQNSKLPLSSKDVSHFSTELGVILHYIADYFCYAHNNKNIDKLPAHLFYEINLDRELKKYLSSTSGLLNEKFPLEACGAIENPLVAFIEERHKEYMKEHPSPLNDVIYGLQACCTTASGIVGAVILSAKREAA